MVNNKFKPWARILEQYLTDLSQIGVAVSGGVDSMTLSVFAHRIMGEKVKMFHAISPAVPPQATERVQRYANQEGWNLYTIDAGEFEDNNYTDNPANRCYFCKQHLYSAIRDYTNWTIVSGTNFDDLTDFRPGLEAAREQGVQHPYVESGVTKKMVRMLAHDLGLDDLAKLPSAPCLSSRIQTGIQIEPVTLRLVNDIEQYLSTEFESSTIRCRVVATNNLVIEIDAQTLEMLSPKTRSHLTQTIISRFNLYKSIGSIKFDHYKMGSAFLRSAV